MKRTSIYSLVTVIGLFVLSCSAWSIAAAAQNTTRREASALKMLIDDDPLMLETQRRNARLSTTERRNIEAAIRELSTSLNGTWELVERTVSNKETNGRMILVPTAGQMVFNLKPEGTQANGDFFILEEGLGNLAVSGGLPNGEPFVLASYNQVMFAGGLEGGSIEGGLAPRFVSQQSQVVIKEQIVGEILGSYGDFQKPTAFRQTSRDLAQYTRRRSGDRSVFVAKGAVAAPSGSEREGSDTWDIIKVSNDVMILGISARGILDVWRKTSGDVTVNKQPLSRHWENLKRSDRLRKPTFKPEQ